MDNKSGTEGGNGHRTSGIPQFIPDAEGLEFAIKIGTHRSVTEKVKKLERITCDYVR